MANSYLALRPRVPISHMAASPRSDSLRRSLPLFEQTLGLEGLEDSEWPSHLALSMHSRKSPDQSPHRFSFCLGPALRGLDRVAATTCLGAFPLWCTVARLTRTATALLSTTTVSSMNLGWSGAISMSPATVGGRRSRTPTHPVAQQSTLDPVYSECQPRLPTREHCTSFSHRRRSGRACPLSSVLT